MKNLKDMHINEKKMMNCGMEATIIAYRKNNDIDVKFADGTIVIHKKYANFTKGKITNPKLLTNRPEQRIGEKNMMNCGMGATIITYKKYDDIDIQFEDGTIVMHKTYDSFAKGKITNPKILTNRPEQRIGEKNMMNCGMEATIIAYRKSNDIDIKFADGTIVTNKPYDSFIKGAISYPTKLRNNQKKIMNCGMEATIIAYRKSNDIDVKFADGTIVTNTSYKSFITGQITNPKLLTNKPEQRIGEKNIMNCGMEATIIVYRKSNDINVKFADGTIVTNKLYDSFMKGAIGYPSFKPSEQIQQFTIIKQITPQYYLVSFDGQEVIQSTANLMTLKYQEQELLSQEAI